MLKQFSFVTIKLEKGSILKHKPFPLKLIPFSLLLEAHLLDYTVSVANLFQELSVQIDIRNVLTIGMSGIQEQIHIQEIWS